MIVNKNLKKIIKLLIKFKEKTKIKCNYSEIIKIENDKLYYASRYIAFLYDISDENIENGYYSIDDFRPIRFDCQYPDFSYISFEKFLSLTEGVKYFKVSKNDVDINLTKIIVNLAKYNLYLNEKTHEVIKTFSMINNIEVYFKDNDYPIYFKNNNSYLVIMPLNYKYMKDYIHAEIIEYKENNQK